MPDSAVGSTRQLVFDTYNDDGEPADAAKTLLYVTEPSGHAYVHVVAPVQPGRYEWPLVRNVPGWWQWSWVAEGGGAARPRAYSGGELIGGSAMLPTTAWCPLSDVLAVPSIRERESKDPVDREALARACLAATEWLHLRTWRRFRGLQRLELRPCCQCQATVTPWRWWALTAWGAAHGDVEPTIDGHAPCGCSTVDEVVLPATLRTVESVTIDGQPFTDWRLDPGRRLVRTDGLSWPCCQSLESPSTALDTFAVHAVAGEGETELARMACAELAAELFLGLVDPKACRVPVKVTTVQRQGSTYQRAETASVNPDGTLGLRITDMFVGLYGRKRRRTAIASPDVPDDTRLVG